MEEYNVKEGKTKNLIKGLGILFFAIMMNFICSALYSYVYGVIKKYAIMSSALSILPEAFIGSTLMAVVGGCLVTMIILNKCEKHYGIPLYDFEKISLYVGSVGLSILGMIFFTTSGIV